MAHKQPAVLQKEIEAAEQQVTIGTTYQHYKGSDKLYTVTGFGFLEATDELCVIYQAQYGKNVTFIRPLAVWMQKVEWEGQTVPRFTKV